MFVHLTTHSAYSLQEGLALPADLAQAAQADGMPALGLTDHRLLSGSVEFVLACREAGVQPLLGLEIDLENGPLALLAMNMGGWSNLCRLCSLLALRDDPAATCPLDLLMPCSADLIALYDPRRDPAGKESGLLREIFPDRLYLTLQDPAHSLPVADFGRRLSLPLVVAHPVYYLSPNQAALQKTLAAIRLNCPIERLPDGAAAPTGAYFVNSREIESRFKGSRAASRQGTRDGRRASVCLLLPHAG